MDWPVAIPAVAGVVPRCSRNGTTIHTKVSSTRTTVPTGVWMRLDAHVSSSLDTAPADADLLVTASCERHSERRSTEARRVSAGTDLSFTSKSKSLPVRPGKAGLRDQEAESSALTCRRPSSSARSSVPARSTNSEPFHWAALAAKRPPSNGCPDLTVTKQRTNSSSASHDFTTIDCSSGHPINLTSILLSALFTAICPSSFLCVARNASSSELGSEMKPRLALS